MRKEWVRRAFTLHLIIRWKYPWYCDELHCPFCESRCCCDPNLEFTRRLSRRITCTAVCDILPGLPLLGHCAVFRHFNNLVLNFGLDAGWIEKTINPRTYSDNDRNQSNDCNDNNWFRRNSLLRCHLRADHYCCTHVSWSTNSKAAQRLNSGLKLIPSKSSTFSYTRSP